MKGNQRPRNQRVIPPAISGGMKHEEESSTGCSDWSSLPVGILDLIAEKLQHFRDRLSLASVCKDWRIPVTPHPLPWVAMFANDGVFSVTSRSVSITFEFYEICCNVDEPCNHRPYKRSLEMATCADRFLIELKPQELELGLSQPELLSPDTPFSDDHFFVTPSIKESKMGWLVVSISNLESLFVYHPFSARSMILPDLHYEDSFNFSITFSGSDPTCSECVFFAVVSLGKDLRIRTWSPGQEVWKERHVIVKDQYWEGVRSVIWLDGIFYWCNCTHMESFNPSNGERKEIAFPSLAGFDDFYGTKFFELNGEFFLLVYQVKLSERIELFFKFNSFNGTWIGRDDCLKDRLLFMSYISPSCYSVLGSGIGNTSLSRVFRSYALRLGRQHFGDKDQNVVVERPIMDCLALTGIQNSHVDWLAPPLKTFG